MNRKNIEFVQLLKQLGKYNLLLYFEESGQIDIGILLQTLLVLPALITGVT